jgi:predicted alpha/beta hydrolase family esterase
MTQQVVYIHGGTTYATYDQYLAQLQTARVTIDALRPMIDWKLRLQETLGGDFVVYAPRMPNTSNAQYDEWSTWFTKVLAAFSDNIILIGHSLGGVFLVTYLSLHASPIRVRATFLVASPHTDTPEEPLISFALPTQCEGFMEQAGAVYVYHSIDDPVVPYNDAVLYAKRFPHATLRTLDGYGHFNTATFPEIVEDITAIARSEGV